MKRYIFTKHAIIIEMEKHIFGTKYYIRDKYIKIAKSRNLKLVIKTPDGIATYTASAWMDGADRMEKVFNFPDRPMILFGKHIKKDVLRRDKRKKIEKRLNQDYNLKGYGQLLRAWKEVQNKI